MMRSFRSKPFQKITQASAIMGIAKGDLLFFTGYRASKPSCAKDRMWLFEPLSIAIRRVCVLNDLIEFTATLNQRTHNAIRRDQG